MPNNWKTYKLLEVSELITKGTTPSTYGYKFIDEGINYIKSDSTNYDGNLDSSVFVSISEEAHAKLKRSQLQEYDILFSIAGAYLGKSGMVKKEHIPANTNQANAIIRVHREKVLPKFINLLLRNPRLVHYINASSGQSAQPNLNLTDLGNLELEIPTLKEQKAIANILSAIDDKIENNLAINKTLEDMAMALYKNWFVDFGPFQDGEFIDSELGLIPKGWEVKRLDEISSMSAGGDKPKNFSKERADGLEIPIYSNGISNEGLYGFTDNARIFEESVTVSARGTIGYVCLRMQPYLPIVRLISLVPKKEYVSSKFLFLCLQNENIQGNGTTQQQLTVPDFKETKIITPNIDIIKDFNGIMDIAYNNIVSNKEENQSLTKLRDTLLSKLISGEVRLKEFREKVEQVL